VSLNHPSSLAPEKQKLSEVDISIIGSSNYTTRSYTLDLEAGALIITTDPDLKKRLGEERDRLLEYTQKMEIDDFMKPDRRVGIRVRVAMWIVQVVGGAL
jgi:CDP-diacylglycerol--glycerol-3-phosphate 3-phosphatidyltransferase